MFKVGIPFTALEWADVLNAEGDYLGTCCANISRIRDILAVAIHDNYYCRTEDLDEAVHLAINHGFKKTEKSPVGKLIRLWNKISKDVAKYETGSSVDINDPHDALEVLYSNIGIIHWSNLFDEESGERKFCNKVNKEKALATIMLCVKTLSLNLKNLSKGTIKGFGIFKNGEIGETNSGIAMYSTKKLAQNICDSWNKESKGFSVHKCQVSMENGLEKLD